MKSIQLLCKPAEVQLCIWLTQCEKNYLKSTFACSTDWCQQSTSHLQCLCTEKDT